MEQLKAIHRYYGKNYSKAMNNLKKGKLKAKTDFEKKYPHADLSKFNFTVSIGKDGDIESSEVWFINNDLISTNVDSDTFRNDYTMNKYLTTVPSKIRTTFVPADFISKYPHADFTKFKFTENILPNGDVESNDVWFINSEILKTNVDSDTFRNSKQMNKYLTSEIYYSDPNSNFPKIWLSNGAIQELPKGNGHFYTRFGERQGYYDGFPVHDILNYPINNFRVYVNGKDYFMSKLPELKIFYPGKPFVWGNGSYFRTLFAVYLSSYCCGVSLSHLTPNNDVFPVVTSVMRFHLYFTVRRLLKRLEKGESMYKLSKEFNGGNLYNKILKLPWTFSYEPTNTNGVKGVKNVNVVKGNYKTHYKRYIPKVSNGLTSTGLQYLNQSIESYIYSVLGSQAKTRVSIINHGGGSLETQQEFRSLVEDGVINYSISTWILNMNKAVSDTFVRQDLAISPKTWLVPSKMVILKKAIVGYNNLLKTASEIMTFGVNDINHKLKPNKDIKKVIEPNKVFKPVEKPENTFKEVKKKPEQEVKKRSKPDDELEEKPAIRNSEPKEDLSGLILAGSIVSGVLISKYVY